MTKGPLATFRKRHITRRIRSRFCRHLYTDRNRDPNASILIAGSARSGTTWLADIIAQATSARIVFEPFHHEFVEDSRKFKAFPYRRVEVNDSELQNFCICLLAAFVVAGSIGALRSLSAIEES